MTSERVTSGSAPRSGKGLSRRSVLMQAACAMVVAACRPWPALAVDTLSPVMTKLSEYMGEARGRALPEAIVEVTDSGPGLDDEQRSRVFERFYRADPSRSRLKGGAGLGLSIVNAIVTAHGGTVRAVSLPGQGASFSVHLPLSHDDSGPALDSAIEVESGAESSS